MSELTERLKAALKFNKDKTLSDTEGSSHYEREAFFQGAVYEAQRRESLDKAFCEVVEALSLRRMHDDDCADSTEKFGVDEMCECGASYAQDALDALSKVIDGGGDE